MREREIECPYCNQWTELNHDDGYGYEEGETFNDECEHCSRVFVYTSSMTWYFDARQAPCKNAQPHDWQQIIGYPKEAFIGRFRCTFCDEEERRDEPARLAALKALYP
jgi:hypothetical protein